ncbi:hypothetical protein K1T71_009146 [Dendrolimus kikuchii]|uniref:Uncharacterized protein n=1 Tax=Dendrolimus kikuchii TaxID=765133 RepID=A0ACC1CTQ7_9NEOP|nr:hypothetical protein K1T71_009146 [Dendrolimus kikuchii]
MFSNQCLWAVVILLLFIFSHTLCVSEAEIYSESIHRSKRQLLFPNSTLLQFNAGIGSPTPAKDINMNFAFQANFQLPWNRTQIPVDILVANSGYEGDSRKKREVKEGYENDARLYHFYHYVEDALNGFGYNGKVCVLKTLCQLGAEPLHSDDDEDLLHELATFVLNPNNDAASHPSHIQESLPYIEAYSAGQKDKDCIQMFSRCSLSLIDTFTKLHDIFN